MACSAKMSSIGPKSRTILDTIQTAHLHDAQICCTTMHTNQASSATASIASWQLLHSSIVWIFFFLVLFPHSFFRVVPSRNWKTCNPESSHRFSKPIVSTLQSPRGFIQLWSDQSPHAGRRTDFRDKNRAIFSGELFSGEELLPEKAVLGQ